MSDKQSTVGILLFLCINLTFIDPISHVNDFTEEPINFIDVWSSVECENSTYTTQTFS